MEKEAMLEDGKGAAIKGSNDFPGAPILAVKTRARVPLTRRRWIAAFIVMFCIMTVVYSVTFYIMKFLEDHSTTIREQIQRTSSKIEHAIAEKYDDWKHPGNPEEVAALMGQFYELLAEMGYYEPYRIAYPPHTNPSINGSYALALGYSGKAVQMMEMLPYLGTDRSDDDADQYVFAWSNGAADGEFLLYGTFVDYRQDGYLEELDPMFALSGNWSVTDMQYDPERYMMPDYVLLSQLGNHGTMMVLNTKNYKLWTIDSESTTTADFALQDLDWPESDNWLALTSYPCRPARLALRDYIQKFRDLEWMPGGLGKGDWTGDNYARLYTENGWPNNYNRTAFMEARVRWEAAENKRWDDEQPFEDVLNFNRTLEYGLRNIKEKNRLLNDLDAGKELPDDKDDRVKYREELVTFINETTEYLPAVEKKLEAARKAVLDIDPLVKKAREDRIAKYHY